MFSVRRYAAFFPEANEWRAAQREAREGWSLLTVETEANRGVQMKGFLPWLVCWARRAGTKDFLFRLGCSS
jgi:hypothetical protein